MITARVRNYVLFDGDQTAELIYDSAGLEDSPAFSELVNLAIGNNAIVPPVVTGFVVHGVTIIPPAANLAEITLKGISGDTGVLLSASQVSVFHFGAVVPAGIVLSVTVAIDGLRLVWF